MREGFESDASGELPDDAFKVAERDTDRGRHFLVAGLLTCPLLLCLFSVVGASAVRSYWEGQLEDELDGLALEGLGTSDEDLGPAPLPADNGADDLAQAFDVFEGLPDTVSLMLGSQPESIQRGLADPTSEEAELVFFHDPSDPGSPKDIPGAAAMIIDALDSVQDLIDAGLSKEIVWPVEWEKGLEAERPHLMAVKDLAQGVAIRGGWAALHERPADAWRDVELILRLAGTLDDSTLIDRLVKLAVLGTSCEMLEQLLRLGPPPEEACRERILQRLEGQDSGKGFTRCMRAELNQALHSIKKDPSQLLTALGVTGKKPSSIVGDNPATRLLYSHWRRDYVGLMAEVIRESTLPPAEALPRFRALDARAQDMSLLAQLLVPALTKAYAKDLGGRVSLRLARCGLRLASGGTLPTRAPDWLPQDLLDANGGALRYRRTSATEALLWSVGPDQSDNGGALADPDNGLYQGADGTDQVFRIALPR